MIATGQRFMVRIYAMAGSFASGQSLFDTTPAAQTDRP